MGPCSVHPTAGQTAVEHQGGIPAEHDRAEIQGVRGVRDPEAADEAVGEEEGQGDQGGQADEQAQEEVGQRA